MAASDYVPIFFKNRLHLAGRPQMSTRPGNFTLRHLAKNEGSLVPPTICRRNLRASSYRTKARLG